VAVVTSSAVPCAITRNLSDLRAVSYSTMLSLGMPILYSPAAQRTQPAHHHGSSHRPNEPAYQRAKTMTGPRPGIKRLLEFLDGRFCVGVRVVDSYYGIVFRQALHPFYPRNSPTTPTMDRTTPPISIHIALSVGAPVKKRAMSELNDLAALKPKMISRIPPASSASATALFMFCLSCGQRPAQRGLSAAGKKASRAGDTGLVLGTF